MIIETRKVGRVKDWRWLLRCEICNNERWVSQGASPEKKSTHHCNSCRSRRAAHDEDVIERRKKTCLERFGHENGFHSPQTHQTVRERYGVESVLQLEQVHQKSRESCRKNHGVEFPLQATEIREKFQRTMMAKFGVEHALQSDAIKSTMNFKESWQKRHEKMKSNGDYSMISSRAENLFADFLFATFARVERQVEVDDHLIDFFLPHENVYIQFDGVYWHGLDREIACIRESTSPRDARIVKAYETDRAQDAWFASHGMTLIRVTDKEFADGKHMEKLNVYLER